MNPPLPAARAAYDAGLRAWIWITALAAVLIFVWVILLTPTNFCFLHLSRTTNANETRLILGVINR